MTLAMRTKKYDYVKIIKPSFFKRCGYEICKEDAISLFKTKEHRDEIKAFLKQMVTLTPNENDIYKITNELASIYMANYKYKSKERKIYSFDLPEYQDALVKILKINYVRTGTYNHGGYGFEDDYYPAYLSDIKTHKILTIDKYIETKHGIKNLQIEVNNVRILTEQEIDEEINSKNKVKTNDQYSLDDLKIFWSNEDEIFN